MQQSKLWRKVGSKLILNTPKINNKNQKTCFEIIFGLTDHSTKQYSQILQKYFFDWSINIFQSLIDYIKIFNRNTVKVSDSCVQNMSKIYKGHNSKITSAPRNQLTLCNCQKCAMDSKCQTMDAVYDCRVTSEPQKSYCGLGGVKWK